MKKKDDTIVYPPEAGPQAAFARITPTLAASADPVGARNGPVRLGWSLLLLTGLFWGCLMWAFGNGTEPVSAWRVFEAAPDYSLPVVGGLAGVALLCALTAIVRASAGPAFVMLLGGSVWIALCLVAGTILREQMGRLTIPAVLLGAGQEDIVLQKKDGWEIRAQSVSLQDGMVKLKVDGKPAEIPLSELNEGSQRRVKDLGTALKH